MKSTFVIKGEIRENNFYGNKKLIRKGTLHFMPNEVVYLNTNRKNFEEAIFNKRVNVVGNHRSGGNRHKRSKLSQLKNFKIVEIQDPSLKTINFLDQVGILHFAVNSNEYQTANQIIEVYSKLEYQEINSKDGDDDELGKAKKQIQEIQDILASNKLEMLADHVGENINIISTFSQPAKVITKKELLNRTDELFNIKVKQNIMKIDKTKIHPTDVRLIAGPLNMIKRRTAEYYKIQEINLGK